MQERFNIRDTACPGGKSEALYEKESTYPNAVIALRGKGICKIKKNPATHRSINFEGQQSKESSKVNQLFLIFFVYKNASYGEWNINAFFPVPLLYAFHQLMLNQELASKSLCFEKGF